jgi:predicted aminopeptidase
VKKKWIFACGIAVVLIAGSAHIKYCFQAACGQIALLAGARPIDTYLADPSVDAALKTKLEKVKQLRNFAVRELKLPDSDSYKAYVEIDRPYVVWNVIATPELSMQPVEWCFPVAGCASYRGYFNKDDAIAFARSMQRAGYDVHVAEVPAYSTLGWFSDPVISTFINYSEPQLARLMFHELAHQILYVKGDSQFNESFAVAIEEEGVERWIAKHGNREMLEINIANNQRKSDFLALLDKYQRRLSDNYTSGATVAEKRAEKVKILNALQDEFRAVKVSWKGYSGYDGWFARQLNNAHLVSIATYHSLVPAFRELLKKQADLPAFYAAARSLASLPQGMRQEQMAALEQENAGRIRVEQVKVSQERS